VPRADRLPLRAGLGAALAAAAVVAAGASPRAEELLVDRVVAVVGDQPILHSAVEQEVQLMRLALGAGDATPDSLLRRSALDRLIDNQLIIAKADMNAIAVSEEEVDQALESTIANMKRQFGSEEAFQEQLAREGMTEADLRQRHRDDIRSEIKGTRLIEREIRSKIEVTDEDMARFYAEHVEELSLLPRRLELAQITVRVQPDDGARAAARAKIESARTAIAAGEPFEEVAKRVSEGPSAPRGGDLGAFRPGQMEESFDAAVAALEPGQLSAPVETRVGVHLIRLDERRDDGAYRAHHIVALYQPDAAARAAARARMEGAVAEIRAGADFGEVARRVSDDAETREAGGAVGLFALDDMPDEYRALVEPLAPGEVSQILESEEGLLVFKLVRIDEPRRPTLDEIKSEVREAAKQQKAADEYPNWVKRLREEIYVRVL
jgi:peptidyl-prolyl cis-trans isomerase SurA